MEFTQAAHEQQLWDQWADASYELFVLARVIGPAMPGIQVPCTCNDGSCDRCEVERIIAKHTPTNPTEF